jgi:hypothetical protein
VIVSKYHDDYLSKAKVREREASVLFTVFTPLRKGKR